MTFKYVVGEKVSIPDIQVTGIVRVRRNSDGVNFYFVEYFSSLLKSMTTQYFRESKLEGGK